jgi:hypothetical protein
MLDDSHFMKISKLKGAVCVAIETGNNHSTAKAYTNFFVPMKYLSPLD